MGAISPEVEPLKDIVYTEGAPEDVAKHKLDLYLPRNKTNFPVMIFLHGGFWRSGDRSWYALLGNRFAKAGIGVVIPSYRLMPKNPHPAQIEDAAAAFAWVYRKIGEYGGDISRIYVTGHSAGGHLASLLALDPDFLKKYDIPMNSIRGVASLSGVYSVGTLREFQAADDDPSPIHHVHPQVPPFLVTYCQWDYLDLPKQARDFAEELKKKFAGVKLKYISGENHISEIIDTLKDTDPTAQALLDFIK
jgi:acetyl esterase/lipase